MKPNDTFFTTTFDYLDFPVFVAPDEFIEFLRDLGYKKDIKVEDLVIAIDDWIEEGI